MITLTLLAVTLPLLAEQNKSPDNIDLFNGHDLTGWKVVGGTGSFKAEGGCIVGTGENIKSNTFLRTEKTYTDFEFSYEFKFDSLDGNSGVMFRAAQKNGDGRVFGYQCEADNGKGRAWTAGLYDEARRGWLSPIKGKLENDVSSAKQFTLQGKTLFKWDEWNTIVIRCQGNHIQTWLNGVQRVDFTDTDPEHDTREGFFALQVHNGKSCNVRWRNLQLRPLN
ncbi:MAG: 3-keto-disaccharide hydrolase [Rubritalea sp.]